MYVMSTPLEQVNVLEPAWSCPMCTNRAGNAEKSQSLLYAIKSDVRKVKNKEQAKFVKTHKPQTKF
jgi:hypothetical protein